MNATTKIPVAITTKRSIGAMAGMIHYLNTGRLVGLHEGTPGGLTVPTMFADYLGWSHKHGMPTVNVIKFGMALAMMRPQWISRRVWDPENQRASRGRAVRWADGVTPYAA